MLSKLFGFFKSKPVVKQPEPEVTPEPLVKLGPEKEQLVTVEYEVIVSPSPQQLEDAFKEEENPKYEKDNGPLTERQVDEIAASVTEETKPPAKKRAPRKTSAKKTTKNGKSIS